MQFNGGTTSEFHSNVSSNIYFQAFSREDLKRLEYAEDLETYYKYGYGSALRDKIGCLPIKDMFSFFSNHISDGNLTNLITNRFITKSLV